MKSETLKKVWTIILTIYVTLATVGCVVFGCLFFLGMGKEAGTGKLSAYELVSEVCYDMGILPRKTTTAEEVVANSVENFNKEKIEYEDMPLGIYDLVATSLIYAKNMTICDEAGENVYQPGEFYFVANSESNTKSGFYFYYSYEKSTFKTSFIVRNYHADSNTYINDVQIDIKIEQTKNDKWHLELADYATSDETGFLLQPKGKDADYGYLEAKANDSGIYFVGSYHVRPETALEDTAFVTDSDKVASFESVTIDVKNKTKTTYTKNLDASEPINDFENDEAKLIEMSNSAIKSARNIGRVKMDINTKFKTGDAIFSEKAQADVLEYLKLHGEEF